MSRMKALAGGWTLTGVGSTLGIGTGIAIIVIGPSVIDPARSCRFRFDESRTFTADAQSFPPRVTCVRDDGQTFDYLSTGATLVTTLLLVAAAALVLVGAALLAATWLRRDATPGPAPTGSRQQHLWLALLLGSALTIAVTGVGTALSLFLGPFIAIFYAAPLLLGAAALAAAVDRTTGPRRPGPRRRGTAVAVGGTAIGAALIQLGLATGWFWPSLLLAVVPYPALAAAQHLLAPARSTAPDGRLRHS
jgi:hypothetical protein